MVGPFFSGKTHLMLKVLPRITPDRDIYIATKSPPEQCTNCKKIKEMGEEIKHLNEYESAIIVSDDILGTSNKKIHRSVFHRRKT